MAGAGSRWQLQRWQHLLQLLHRIAPVAGVVAFALAGWILWRELAGHGYAELLSGLRQAPTSALALALVLTVAGYAVRTGQDLLALRFVGRRLPLRSVLAAAFVANAVSNNVGNALITGAATRYWIYASAGLSAAENTRVVVFCGIGGWLGWLGLGAIAGMAAPGWRLAGSALALLVAAYLLLSALRPSLSIGGWQLRLPSFKLGLGQLLVGMAELAFMAATLGALLWPAGGFAPDRFLVAFVLASLAGAASHVPGGLGVFEGVMLSMLGGQVGAPQLVAALLLYRAIYLVLPLLLASVAVAWRLASRRRLQALPAVVGPLVPNVLAAATFVAGALLLFSGAVPVGLSRLRVLDQLLGLPLIEASHFAASLIGVALLVVARGLQRRLDAAWWLACLMLGGAMVLSVAKGAGGAQMVVPGVVLAALLPSRAQFYRRSRLLAEPMTPAWLAAVAVVLGASVGLLLLAHSEEAMASQPWWDFALHSQAARASRAAVGSSVLVLGLGLQRLLTSPPVAAAVADPQALERVRPIVEASAQTYAHLVYRGDKAVLFSDSGQAFLMYAFHGRTGVSMGDPVGDEAGVRELAWRFREICDRAGMWCAFFEVGPQRRELYASLGLALTPLGSEARVDLRRFTLDDPAYKGLRHERSRLARQGCVFEIVPAEAVPPLLPQLQAVSQAWLAAKPTAEKQFSTARFDPDYLARFPVAVVRQGSQVLAFANLWLGAGHQELSLDLMRHRPQAPHGTMDLLFSELMLWGRAEGFHWFNFGMAPLYGVGAEGGDRRLWPRAARLLYRHGGRFYNFQGLQRYKAKFRPEWTPLYLASPGGLALPQVMLDIATMVAGGVPGLIGKGARKGEGA